MESIAYMGGNNNNYPIPMMKSCANVSMASVRFRGRGGPMRKERKKNKKCKKKNIFGGFGGIKTMMGGIFGQNQRENFNSNMVMSSAPIQPSNQMTNFYSNMAMASAPI